MGKVSEREIFARRILMCARSYSEGIQYRNLYSLFTRLYPPSISQKRGRPYLNNRKREFKQTVDTLISIGLLEVSQKNRQPSKTLLGITAKGKEVLSVQKNKIPP